MLLLFESTITSMQFHTRYNKWSFTAEFYRNGNLWPNVKHSQLQQSTLKLWRWAVIDEQRSIQTPCFTTVCSMGSFLSLKLATTHCHPPLLPFCFSFPTCKMETMRLTFLNIYSKNALNDNFLMSIKWSLQKRQSIIRLLKCLLLLIEFLIKDAYAYTYTHTYLYVLIHIIYKCVCASRSTFRPLLI